MAESSELKANQYVPTGSGDSNAYKLVFDESLRTLELLDRRADALRTGYVAVLAFVGSGTAFLAGNVLTSVERNPTVRWLAFFATACFVAALSLGVFDLWPRKRHAGVNATPLVEYIDAFPAAYNVTLARLAQQNAEIAGALRKSIGRVGVRFACFLGLSTMSVILWIILAWVGDPVSAKP